MKKGTCKRTELALHTHDSLTWKRCRRKWSFSSPFARHLQPKSSLGVNQYLWFGSGFHYALEDYHGYNRYKDPVVAFLEYIKAHQPEEVPENIEELEQLGIQMLSYYKDWEKKYAKWQTVWLDDKPLVEVQFSLVLDELCHYVYGGEKYYYDKNNDIWKSEVHLQTEDILQKYGEYKEIVFHGTFDRIVSDEQGNWWVLDYKTAKAFDTGKLSLDQQISNYCWAAEQWFDRPIEGMVYLQCSKTPPKAPKITKTGVSADKRQVTTHALYREALINYYGEVQAAPAKNVQLLNDLADAETENGDRFIRYDFVHRNEYMKIETYRRILAEGREFLDEKTVLYPNPTRDCAWDCPFRSVCLAMEEGADWEFLLDDFEVRNETMKQEIPRWQIRMYRHHRDLFPEEYKKYCTDSADTLEEFMQSMKEED